MITASTLLSSVVLAGAQAVPELGERLPPIVIEDLRQTEARTYAEFYGRPVLIELFDYWSRPCVPRVAQLNRALEAYGARGLVVVAVTSEAPQKTVPWIEKHGARYAYGFDPSGGLRRLFEADEVPFAVLVDAQGTLSWSGNPARLRPQDVEPLLADAPAPAVWQWPASARPLAVPLHRGEYATALRQAAELPTEADFDPSAFVRGRIQELLARFERLAESGDPGAAFLFGQRLRQDLIALPEAAQLAARMEELLGEPASRREIEAAERMLAFERRLRKTRGLKQVLELRAELAAFAEAQAGRRLEPRARELLARLERALERGPEREEDP